MIDQNVDPYDLKNLELYHPEVRDASHIYQDGYDIVVLYSDGRAFALDDVNNSYRKICDDFKMTEEETNAEFGYRLRRRMYINGLTCKQFAEQTGISETTISGYRRGKSTPRFHILNILARGLNCSIDEFRFIPRR